MAKAPSTPPSPTLPPSPAPLAELRDIDLAITLDKKAATALLTPIRGVGPRIEENTWALLMG